MTILFIILVQGCIPHSDNPLTDPDKGTNDTSIIGTWFWQDENESGYLHIGLDDKTNLLRVIMLDIDDEKRLDESEYVGHTSSLGGNKYINLKWVRPEQNEITGYMFVKYKVDADSLGIAIMSKDIVETAVINASLKGTANKNDVFAAVHITDEQKKIQEFILKNDKELFTEMTYMQKLTLPEFKYGKKNTD